MTITSTPTALTNNMAYLGITDFTPGNNFVRRRPPTTSDLHGYNVGDRWIDKSAGSAYVLVSKSNNIASWIPVGGGAGALSTLNGVAPLAGNINLTNAGAINITPGPPGIVNINVKVDGTTITIVGDQLTAGALLASQYTTDAGIAIPAAGNLNVLGTAVQGISTSGAGSTVTVTAADATAGTIITAQKGVSSYDSTQFTVTTGFVQLSGTTSGTVTTVGAVTGNVITFTLPAVPATVAFDVLVAGFASAGPGTPVGASYSVIAGARTTGVAGFLTGTPDVTSNEEAAMLAADATVVIAGNNAIVQVTGVAGLTIEWRAVLRSVTAP
jgi:hypothetical protein